MSGKGRTPSMILRTVDAETSATKGTFEKNGCWQTVSQGRAPLDIKEKRERANLNLVGRAQRKRTGCQRTTHCATRGQKEGNQKSQRREILVRRQGTKHQKRRASTGVLEACHRQYEEYKKEALPNGLPRPRLSHHTAIPRDVAYGKKCPPMQGPEGRNQ